MGRVLNPLRTDCGKSASFNRNAGAPVCRGNTMRLLNGLLLVISLIFPAMEIYGQVAPPPLPHQDPAFLHHEDGRLRASGPSSSTPMVPGQVLQTGAFDGQSPFGICAQPATRTLFVSELHGGSTYLYNIDQIYAGSIGTIPNPGGAVTTTGISSDGNFLYWMIPGAFPNLWRSGFDGSNPESLGQVIPPAFGVVGDITIDENGDLWVTDVTNDQYSRHSTVDGSFLGGIIPHPGGGGSGNGIAFRSDCSTLAIPHNSPGSVEVDLLSAVNLDGSHVEATPLPPIGGFINGIEAYSAGSTGVPSFFIVDNSGNRMLEIEAQNPCPVVPTQGAYDYQVCGRPGINQVQECAGSLPLTGTDGAVTNLAIVSSTSFQIDDVEVDVRIEHPDLTELVITLTSPQGTSMTLHEGGASGNTILDLLWDDSGAFPGTVPWAAGLSIQPSGPGNLAVFNGENSIGTWNLAISDNVGGGAPVVVAACLMLSSTPGLQVSHLTTPVLDTISIDRFNTVRDIDVALEITHSFSGDLRVWLESPSGVQVALLNENTTLGPNLDLVFDDDGDGIPVDGPGSLADFVGEDVFGGWNLEVHDPFPGDDGILHSWCLRIDESEKRKFCLEQPRLQLCDAPQLPISSATNANATINVIDSIQVHDLDVTLDVSHSWIGDLDISISSPEQTTVGLIANGLGYVDGIHTVFDDEGIDFDPQALPTQQSMQAQGPGVLADFFGQSAQGDWTLGVTDTIASDDGVLDSWCLGLLDAAEISSAQPLEITFIVTDDIAVSDVDLQLNITHADISDLKITLQSPSGTLVVLEENGGSTGTELRATYDDSGLPHGSAPLGGNTRIQPEGLPFSTFYGESMVGDWVVKINDLVGGSNGVLESCCLHVSGDDPPCVSPTIIATANIYSGQIPLEVGFISDTTGTEPATILWNFSDGIVSLEQNPVHTFNIPGIYEVTATMTNDCGTYISNLTIVACQSVNAEFSVQSQVGLVPFCAEFTDLTTGSVNQEIWDFGDGTSDIGLGDRTHTYSQPGYYTVSLQASGQCGSTSFVEYPGLLHLIQRGDVNADGLRDTSDPISLVIWLFGIGTDLQCPGAADVNGDGVLDLADVLHDLIHLFGNGVGPVEPIGCGSCAL